MNCEGKIDASMKGILYIETGIQVRSVRHQPRHKFVRPTNPPLNLLPPWMLLLVLRLHSCLLFIPEQEKGGTEIVSGGLTGLFNSI